MKRVFVPGFIKGIFSAAARPCVLRKRDLSVLRCRRSQSGSMLAVAVITACAIIVPVCALMTNVLLREGQKNSHQAAVDAACLARANVVPEIVIDDPVFGFVARSAGESLHFCFF